MIQSTDEEDDVDFIFDDDDSVDEGVIDLKSKSLQVRTLKIAYEGGLMTIPDEDIWF